MTKSPAAAVQTRTPSAPLGHDAFSATGLLTSAGLVAGVVLFVVVIIPAVRGEPI